MWGCSRLLVGNLFSLRATYPEDLLEQLSLSGSRKVVGADNDRVLAELVRQADTVVAAWGAQAERQALRFQATHVRRLLRGCGKPIFCLGLTKGGSPRHPLMVPAMQPLQLWEAV